MVVLLIILFTAIWYVTFIASFFGVSFVSGAVTAILLSMFVFILPGFNALLLPYRRPDLYELIPQSMRKKFGIPLISILGIIWLVFVIPVFFLYVIWPLLATAYGVHLADVITFAVSQGWTTFAAITIAGIIIYYAARWYNAKRGIDLSLLFKSVPPE
ncbi:MAG: hypothetical protein ABSF82_01580 [Candidatus Bathyarchaeia archaeon]